MRKLYITLAAFAALTLSQIGHAIPTIPGATDIATDDDQTFYALVDQGGAWSVQGYDAAGNTNGFSIQLSANGGLVDSNNARYVGLAYDGSSFFALRDDNASKIARDSYSVLAFDASGAKSSVSILQRSNGDAIQATAARYAGLSVVDEGFFALRNDLISAKNTDSFTLVNFDHAGVLNKAGNILNFNGVSASTTPYDVVASFNMSPAHHVASTNQVPEPSTGLLLGSLLALGMFARKKK